MAAPAKTIDDVIAQLGEVIERSVRERSRLGMNAHINFDLGIAAATICPGDALPTLKHDFNEINTILAGLVGQVEREIDRLSPVPPSPWGPELARTSGVPKVISVLDETEAAHV